MVDNQRRFRIVEALPILEALIDHSAEPLIAPEELADLLPVNLGGLQRRLGCGIDEQRLERRREDDNCVIQAVENFVPQIHFGEGRLTALLREISTNHQAI